MTLILEEYFTLTSGRVFSSSEDISMLVSIVMVASEDCEDDYKKKKWLEHKYLHKFLRENIKYGIIYVKNQLIFYSLHYVS